MTHRFFVTPQTIRDDRVILRGTLVHQLRDVLRLGPGDSIVLLDNTGAAYRTELTAVDREVVRGQIADKWTVESEPTAHITLYQGLLKGQKLEWVLQKGTELGITAFVPVLTSRCVVSHLDDVSSARFERWQKVIVEAAEQAGRARIPRLAEPVLFRDACKALQGAQLALIPWEEEKERHFRETLRQAASAKEISIFVGPEGGFADFEISLAKEFGVLPVTLGPRILRAETAGLVTAAAVLYEFGDFG